ncbi:MAG TPA: HAD family hydrolase [Anaerolineae bacterium]|nr:HAD family hydrolase [Anaerolineae bacterium]
MNEVLPFDAAVFSAVILDFNGVLWWDGALQEAAWQRVAERLRGSPMLPAEMARHVHGRHNRHTLSYLLGRPVDEAEAERLGEDKEMIYRALCLEQGEAFRLSPGAESLLDFLTAGGVPRTIATASGARNLEFFAAHLDLVRWFDLDLVVYDDGTRPGKPAPDVYLEAARRLALPPARCIVVEDSLSGIEAARAAGIGCVVGLGPVPLAGAELTIESLEAFPRGWLEPI